MDPVGPGGKQIYTLSVINDGPFAATGVLVEDTLAAEVTYLSSQSTAGSCGHAGGVVSCNLGTLAVGAAVEIEIAVRVDPLFSGTLLNGATVTANESDPIPITNLDSEETTVDPTVVFVDGFESGNTAAWN